MLIKISTNNFSNIPSQVKHISRKLRRKLYKIPPLQAIQDKAYQNALDNHSKFLPKLDSQGTSILEKLHQEGTCIIPLEELGLSSTRAMMSTALTLAHNLKLHSPKYALNNNCEIGSSAEDMREFPDILLWALEPKLLDIVENYIGLPILYQDFAMRRSIADGQCSGVRRWHIDWEDRRLIKIIIYLNDVVAGGGPYEYISRKRTTEAIKKLNSYNLGYISDEEMAAAVPKSCWTACLGKKGSVIISDTGSVFHRAQPPTENDRFSITFCYTSTNPQISWGSRKISQHQWEIINSNTNQRQKTAYKQSGYFS